jgi:hypothetical protein
MKTTNNNNEYIQGVGTPVTEIKSSRFCHGKLIELMQEIKKNWKVCIS